MLLLHYLIKKDNYGIYLFLIQIFVDELTLKVPRDGGVQKLAEILNHINDKCRLLWIVPSSSSLMDTSNYKKKKNISKDQFTDL